MSNKLQQGGKSAFQVQSRLLGPKQAAQYLGISRSLLYDYLDISGGPIPSKELRKRGNLRGKRLIRVDDLDDFVNNL